MAFHELCLLTSKFSHELSSSKVKVTAQAERHGCCTASLSASALGSVSEAKTETQRCHCQGLPFCTGSKEFTLAAIPAQVHINKYLVQPSLTASSWAMLQPH
jgi:hypothetical protein